MKQRLLISLFGIITAAGILAGCSQDSKGNRQDAIQEEGSMDIGNKFYPVGRH